MSSRVFSRRPHWAALVAIAAALSTAPACGVTSVTIRGSSMSPTFLVGDDLVAVLEGRAPTAAGPSRTAIPVRPTTASAPGEERVPQEDRASR